MARISTTDVSISQLNSVYGFGNNLSAYTRSSTSVKSNTIAHAPVSGTVSIGRLRGSYPSGTYRNINTFASSSTTAVNVTPRNPVRSYSAGLSNNSDPYNAYTLLWSQGSGNRGSGTTSNIFSQTMNTGADRSAVNGMYFRIANGATYPFAAAFEEPGAWVVAIGLNHFDWQSGGIFFIETEAWYFYGDTLAYFANWSPTLAEIYDGNNFFAHFASGGSQQFGFLNRTQLRAGVIQPVYQLSMFGPGGTIWDNSAQNITFRHGIITSGGDRFVELRIGWDEILVRGYDLQPEHNMFGTSNTTTRAKVVNPGTSRTIDGRIFE